MSERSKGKGCSVNSMEHASLVIQSLRSFSHSQKCYHRAACSDDNIFSSFQEFDRLVARKAEEVEKAKQVKEMISNSGVKERSLAATNKTTFDEDDIDFSSDDEDSDIKHKASQRNQSKRHSKNPSTSPNNNRTGTVIRHDDSDDDLLGGLDSDDEEDMAELMKGFVGPSSSRQSAQKNSHSKTPQSGHASAIADLDDSLDASMMSSLVDTDTSTSKPEDGTSASRSVRSAGSASRETTDSSSKKATPKSLQSRTDSFKGLKGNPPSDNSRNPKPSSNVMITPGQRIRVRPSRRNKS